MRVVCSGIGRGHDQQPDTLRISFEEAEPPHATALNLTVSVADAGKFIVGQTYEIAEPVLVLPEPIKE